MTNVGNGNKNAINNNDSWRRNNKYIVAITNRFDEFRRRIDFIDIDTFNNDAVQEHLNFINFKEDQTLYNLINDSIIFYNQALDKTKKRIKNYIVLSDQELACLCVKYNNAHKLYNANKDELFYEMYFLQNHNLTIFITKLILFYMYNELFRQKIKWYQYYNKSVCDVLVIRILYYKLVQLCNSFNNCHNLQYNSIARLDKKDNEVVL